MDANDPAAPRSDTLTIVQIMREVCPLESDLLGSQALAGVVAGQTYQSVPGGSHIDLMNTVALLSGVATIAQFVIQLRDAYADDRETPSPSLHAHVRSLVEERARQATELAAVLQSDPDLVERVIGAATRVLTRQARASG